jgi:hypothetical protein
MRRGIVAVQEESKIVFEPGSVEISEAAGEILDRIAEILPDCLHVPMEIGGHTDSQGREEMNLGLSQSRADAVLNGLLARGVLVSNLTARGYGETRPIADNETEEGRERNRRIEFRLQDVVDARDAAEAEAEAEAERLEAYGLRPDSTARRPGRPAEPADVPRRGVSGAWIAFSSSSPLPSSCSWPSGSAGSPTGSSRA